MRTIVTKKNARVKKLKKWFFIIIVIAVITQ